MKNTYYPFHTFNWPHRLMLALAVLLGMIKAPSVNAQFTYTFSAVTGTYTQVSAGGADLNSIEDDDEHSASIPLGFAFGYNGAQVTNVKVNSNGWISMETGDAPSAAQGRDNSSFGSANGNVRPGIMALWDDLDGENGTARYETTGSAGSRVFTMEWRNWQWNYNASGNTISFQCKLYEGTNAIEFIYRQESGSVSSGSASIGLLASASGTYYSLNNTGTSPTASTSTATTNLSTKPATGQIYRFTPSGCSGPAISNTTSNSPICATSTLNLTTTATGTAPLFYAWTGTGTFSSTTTSNPTVTGAATGTYSVTVRNWCGTTTSTNGSTSVVITPVPTAAAAGADQTLCTSSISAVLAANVPGTGAGVWSIVSVPSGASNSLGQFSNTAANNATFTPAPLVPGAYTLRWNISNAPCAASTDNVVITWNAPPALANAGNNQTMCVSGTTPLAASPGTGAWSILAGSPSTATSQLSNTSSPTATFDPSGGAGVYTLRWTTSNPPCASTQDDVVISVNALPTASNAGPDQNICITTTSSTILAANVPSVGTGTWSIVSGPSTSLAQLSSTTANNATFTYSGGAGTYTLRWTISNSPCASSTNDVAVTVLPFAQPVTQTFNANGTFTVPMGVTQITVQAWGGGGAGGGANNAGGLLGSNSRIGGGGGGGAYVSKVLTVTPGSGLNVVVGAAVNGASAANGTDGNPSTITGFETQVFADGGNAGAANTTGNTPAGGSGGTTAASVGDIEVAGANGGNGATGSITTTGGTGGAGANGGGAGGPVVAALTTASGSPGTAPGGGGGGGRTQGNGGNTSGGSGAAGRVIITYTPTPSISATATTICEGSSTTLTATGGGTYLWSPGGATSASIVVNPGTTTNYSVQITNTCPVQLAQEITVIAPPNAGSSNTLSLCSTDAPADMGALLGVHDPGSWSGPSTVVNAEYDPATMVSGVYTYTVTGTAPCPNATATVTVTENAATLWYADLDGDGSGDASSSQLACAAPANHVADNTDLCPTDANKQAPGQCGCGNPDTDSDGDSIADCIDACPLDANNDQDGDGICGNVDSCPTVFGQNGDACDANPGMGYTLGQITNCACAPVACSTNLTIEFQTDMAPYQLTWQLFQQGTNTLVQSGGPMIAPNGVQTESTCLPNGCYYLKVLDAGGDGIANGGYILRTAGSPGTRIIDNRRNFSSGGVSQIAGNEGFCLPMGNTGSIFTSCDKLDWITGEYYVCGADPAVSAQHGGANAATSGYEFWIYNPNGGYSFRRFRSHTISDGFAPDNASRACHMKINNWAAAQHIPANVLMNMRIRTRIAGVNGSWGPACRMMIDPVRAACPLTKLMDIPGNQHYSCNTTRAFTIGQFVHARPVTGATQYQFRFRIDAEGFVVMRTVSTYFVQLNWTTLPLQDSKTYQVDVRAFKGGQWCIDSPNPAPGPNYTAWGEMCSVTIDNTPMGGGNENMAMEAGSTGSPAQLVMYPNPNRGDRIHISLGSIDRAVNTVSVEIFDLTGKRASARSIAVRDGALNSIVELNDELPGGIYLVKVTAGEEQHTQRLVIEK